MPLPTRGNQTSVCCGLGQAPIPLLRGPQQAPWLHSWVGRAAPQPAFGASTWRGRGQINIEGRRREAGGSRGLRLGELV